MADSTLNGLTNTIASVDRATDLIGVWDDSAALYGKAVVNTILGIIGDPVGTSDAQTLSSKTLTNPTLSTPEIQGSVGGTYTLAGTYTLGGTPTFPASLATLTGAQTLTNKTLTTPTINNPVLNADVISEFTAAAGVTIDGLQIKDGTVAPGSITPAALVAGTGALWTGTTFTPTWTGITIGNATVTAKYLQVGKTVQFQIEATLGGTSAVAAGPHYVTLPVTSVTYQTGFQIAQVLLVDASGDSYDAFGWWDTTGRIRLLNKAVSGTSIVGGSMSSTAPFTWTSGDKILINGSFEAA